MGRISATLLVGAVAAAVVGGCAGQSTGDGRPGGVPEVRPSWTSCDADGPDIAATAPALPVTGDSAILPRLGDDFQPVAAVLCRQLPLRRSDGGESMMATESRADDITALVAALRLPDEPLTGGPCTADLVIAPWLALIDGEGRWVRPGVPHDACGKPRMEFRAAVDALTLKQVGARPVAELESAAAAKAGCSQTWADMVWVETNNGSGAPAASMGALPARAAQVRLCVYRVPASEQRSGKPAGDFAFGGTLDASRWAAVERSIRAAGPAKPCTTPASRFAVLRPVADGPETYVELTGCRRILVTALSGPPALRQADKALIDLLAKG